MSRFIKNLYFFFLFDRKTMGVTFFVPVIIFMLVLFLILFIPREGTDVYINIIVIQGIYIPFSCWCLMYRLSEMYIEGAQETLIPYYSKNFPKDFGRYLTINVLGVFLLCLFFIFRFGVHSLPVINIIHFIILVLFYMFFGTALVVTIKNIEISLTVIVIYTVLEIVTLGEFMPWPHIFLFTSPSWDSDLSLKFSILVISVLIALSVTIAFIRKADRKPS